MSSTMTQKAVVGRRVEFTYYSDLDQTDRPAYPGIITGTEPGLSGNLLARVRLDGRRSNLRIPVAYEGLRYLDEVVDVPALPMGRFHPTPEQLEGKWEGVPVCSISEDGDIVLLTTERDAAVRAATTYLTDKAGVDLDYVHFDWLELRWAYFEWQPEDSETDWYMHWAREGDDHAIQLYYLPA